MMEAFLKILQSTAAITFQNVCHYTHVSGIPFLNCGNIFKSKLWCSLEHDFNSEQKSNVEKIGIIGVVWICF